MVALTFSVTDRKGNSIAGLTPGDLVILENGVPQHIAALAEGSQPAFSDGSNEPAGASVFILFDTSNSMYRMFPYVYDAVAGFVRRLAPHDQVAIYTFSRNLHRAADLTRDRTQAQAGLINIAAGDDTALFNSILLTLREAAKIPGRKSIVVFSNGPDNASTVAPYDVASVAEDEGIPIYIVSTQDPDGNTLLAGALRSLTARSGGKVYWARRWQDQAPAFQSVQTDINTSYTAYYYPSPDAEEGFRRIEVKLVAPDRKDCHVRTRSGYLSRPGRPKT